MSNKVFRPVLDAGAPVQTLNETTDIWGSKDQPWLHHGITMQYSSTRWNGGRSVHVASEALDVETGQILASTSHPACTHSAVRGILADRARKERLAA